MPRVLRCVAPGTTQHVVQRGNNQSTCFLDTADHWLYRECIAEAIQRYPCDVHAYVFMPNHVHLLMTQHAPAAIGKVMQSIGRRYVRRFNHRHARTGTLWEGRYYAKPIDTVRYLLTCYRYIELNPIRAHLVHDLEEVRWSSYGANAFGRSDAIVTHHPIYASLGRGQTERLAAYRALFDTPIDDAARDAIRPRRFQARPDAAVG